MADTAVIETVDLKKSYDGAEALRGLSFSVPAGSVCGFLGRNGAGKTTTLKVLLGLTRPTAGTARVFGLDSADKASSVTIRQRAGFVSDEKALYDAMSVEDMIRFTASFFPKWRKDLETRYLHKFDLPLGRDVKDLSRGMRTKLSLLLSLCRGAELLLLDEPTSGLDPAMTEEVLQALVSHVASEELTIFFSSHQLTDVEQIADRVTFIDRGRTVVSGELDAVRDGYRRVQGVFEGELPASPLRSSGVIRTHRRGRVLSALTNSGADGVLAEMRGLGASSVEIVPVTLKEIFLETVTVEA